MTQTTGRAQHTQSKRPHWLPLGHPISWCMLAVTIGAILMTSIDRVILPTVLPAVMADFGLDETQGGFLVSLSFLGSTIGGVVLGIYGDSFGRGPGRAWAWLMTIIVVIGAAIGTAWSYTLAQFQVLRVAMGIGTGSMEPVNVAMVGEWWQKEDRGFAVGAHHTGFPLGQLIGPALIGVTIATGSWRTVFLVLPLLAVPVCIAQLILARRRNLARVNQWITDHGMTPSVSDEDAAIRPPSAGAPQRLKQVLFSDRAVILGVIANFLFLWTETGVVTFLTLQLTRNAGMTLAAAAIVSGASGATGWIGQIGWGILSDYKGRRFVLAMLSCGLAVTIFALAFVHSAMTAWIGLIVWGLFRNSPYPVLYSAMIDVAPNAASSALGLMVGLGLGLSGVVAAPVTGFFLHNYGFTASYASLAAVSLIALLPIALMKRT